MANDFMSPVDFCHAFAENSAKASSSCADISADTAAAVSAFIILIVLPGSLLGLADSLLAISLPLLNFGVFRFHRKRVVPQTA